MTIGGRPTVDVVLAEAANALISHFALAQGIVLRLPFNPIELLEEAERLFRRATTFLLAFDGLRSAVWNGPCIQYGLPLPACASGIAITHHYAAIITQEGLRMYLAATRLVIEKNDRLVTVLATPIGPSMRSRIGGDRPVNKPHPPL